MQGWRKSMEDAHLCIPNLGDDVSLFGVFDGHGGQQVALFSQKNLPNLIKNSASFKTKNYKQALIDAFLGLDKYLESPEGRKDFESICADGSKGGSDATELANFVGCTACVALITKTEIYVANAGDSRCVLSKNGIAINMSEDHKPDLENERKRIEKAEGFVEDNRVNAILNLSRSLGDLEYKQNRKLKQEEQMITAFPDVKVEKIANDTDFLIIGCDGIWDCLSSQKAVDFVGSRLSKPGYNSSTGKPTGKISKIIEEMLDSIIVSDINEKGIL